MLLRKRFINSVNNVYRPRAVLDLLTGGCQVSKTAARLRVTVFTLCGVPGFPGHGNENL